jgi:hypothetical protein
VAPDPLECQQLQLDIGITARQVTPRLDNIDGSLHRVNGQRRIEVYAVTSPTGLFDVAKTLNSAAPLEFIDSPPFRPRRPMFAIIRGWRRTPTGSEIAAHDAHLSFL